VTKKRRRPVGETIGGILVGFDQQIFRDMPPAQELVHQARSLRGVAGLGDGREIVFPDDEPANRQGAGDDEPAPGQPVDADAPEA